MGKKVLHVKIAKGLGPNNPCAPECPTCNGSGHTMPGQRDCPDCPGAGETAVKCDKCGAELRVGEWPFCPHGPAGRFGDDPIEPYFDEHICPEGAYITTRGERRALMSKQHFEYNDVSKKKRGKLYFFVGGK